VKNGGTTLLSTTKVRGQSKQAQNQGDPADPYKLLSPQSLTFTDQLFESWQQSLLSA
jgi:hypothetical protein